MLFTIVAFALMAGAASSTALSLPFATAIAAWLGGVALGCVLAALALHSQPVGVSTTVGKIGSLLLRWGYQAGHGKLPPVVAISWLVWALLGCAIISLMHFRVDNELQLITVAWVVDLLALLYILGVVLARRSGSMFRNLLPVGATLLGMLVVSAVQWTHPLLPGGRHTALLIAVGPPLFIGAGYGLFLLVMLTAGRKARWN
jgi:hypothetical protein